MLPLLCAPQDTIKAVLAPQAGDILGGSTVTDEAVEVFTSMLAVFFDQFFTTKHIAPWFPEVTLTANVPVSVPSATTYAVSNC